MGRPPRQDKREQGTGRSKRVPLGVPRLKLNAERLIPTGKKGRWINDDPGRLQSAEEGGYAFVTDPNAEVGEGAVSELDKTTTHVRRRMGTRADGSAVMGYLMVIDEELWKADKAEQEGARRQTEDTIRRGVDNKGGLGTDERYIPKEGIKIQHGREGPRG
jgi:hypothetical protein